MLLSSKTKVWNKLFLHLMASVLLGSLLGGCESTQVTGLSTQKKEQLDKPVKPVIADDQSYKAGDITFRIPRNSQIIKTEGEGIDFIIQSPKGYLITLGYQSVPIGRSLKEMERDLDNRHLGTGKRWERKLAYRTFPIQTISAFDLLYKGPHTTDRVLLWLVAGQAYTATFLAPHASFDRLTAEFDYFIDSFELADVMGAKKEPPIEKVSKKTGLIKTVSLQSTYHGQELGFSLSYPKNWQVEKIKPTSVEIGGKLGSPEYLAFVEVQNVLPQTTGQMTPIQVMLDDLKGQVISQGKDVQFVDIKENNQIRVEYSYRGNRHKQWVAVIPQRNGNIYHVWTFTAPKPLFEELVGKAEAMYKSMN